MTLDRITLSSFRNHCDTRLDGTAALNLLVGENGAGKTNVFEALSLFAPGRGLRRAALSEMAARSHDGGFAVSAGLRSGDAVPVMLGTGTDPARPGRRLVQINGVQASAVALGEWLAVSWLTPTMDGLFTDSATARRRYMDRLALALEPSHARRASRYEEALRERNRLLSEPSMPDQTWLASIERQMAEAGAALTAGRRALVDRLSASLADWPDRSFARPTLEYLLGGPEGTDALTEALEAGRARDRAAGRSLIGPHRDELQVTMASKAAPAAQCSTGEQKAMLLAITLAHAELAARGRPGLLLLDEVAAHLDPLRRSALFERLESGGAQVWMTGTEASPFATIESTAATWRIADGKATRRD